ncbi:MAG TPA: hypothetical protein VL907_00760 [Pyrinomonadaceae bacterium]|nr:hypothetical protein [Pyrinomonadaceae bacterium]
MRRPLRVDFEAGVSGGSSFFGKRGTYLTQNAARSRRSKPRGFEDPSIVDRDAELA